MKPAGDSQNVLVLISMTLKANDHPERIDTAINRITYEKERTFRLLHLILYLYADVLIRNWFQERSSKSNSLDVKLIVR